MSKFTTPLIVEVLDDGLNYQIHETFEYYTNLINQKKIIIPVEKGFITDFASTPRGLWWLLPPTGKYGKASVIHDYLYKNEVQGVTKDIADKIFLEAMEVLKVPKWKRQIMYQAVKVFGTKHYKGL